MKTEKYLGMRPGDLDGKPYARYWNPDMAPLPAHVQAAILQGPEPGQLGLPVSEADRLMDTGYLPLETGTATLANGSTLVAVRTEMPRITGAMFEWWMGWHYMEAQRYKLWHPRAHVDNGTDEQRGDDPGLSDKQKYMTTHYATEYIGAQYQELAITFLDPSTVMTRTSDFTVNGVTALVCARVSLRRLPIALGYLVHQIREVKGGSEMRSRFWIGQLHSKRAKPGSLRNRILGSSVVSRIVARPDAARDLLVHCAMEMNHLASFLPDLYTDYH